MTKKAKLRWQCRRGMLELDAILQPFFEQHFDNLTPEQQQAFERLLLEPDPVLYAWFLGYTRSSDLSLQKMVELIARR